MEKMINRMVMITAGLLRIIASSVQKSSSKKYDKLVFLNGSGRHGKVFAFLNDRVR